MLTTQARLAMRNNQPVRTSRMIATIKKIGLAEGKYEPIDVDIEYLERA